MLSKKVLENSRVKKSYAQEAKIWLVRHALALFE